MAWESASPTGQWAPASRAGLHDLLNSPSERLRSTGPFRHQCRIGLGTPSARGTYCHVRNKTWNLYLLKSGQFCALTIMAVDSHVYHLGAWCSSCGDTRRVTGSRESDNGFSEYEGCDSVVLLAVS